MKVNVNSNALKNALEKIQVKGKYVKKGGLSSGKLEDVFYMKAEDDTLILFSGNPTMVVNISIEAEVLEEGDYIGKSAPIIDYLKKFGETVSLENGDFLSISSGSKKASLPRVVEWASLNSILRASKAMTEAYIEYEADKLPTVGLAKYEGCFMVQASVFSDVISSCELVGSGVYKLDFKEESLEFSSTFNTTNNYKETVQTVFRCGDPATVEFSGPIHNFFEKDQMLTFYVLDEAPLFVVADDRRIIKAPYVAGV